MSSLSASQIALYAAQAGFSGSDIVTATAVALAESGGDPNSHNTTAPDDSYGLWQINMLGTLGPARLKQFGLSTASQLFDPLTNAKAAYSIFKSSGWKAWTTYTSGKYSAFLTVATTGVAGAPQEAPQNQGSLNLNPFSGIESVLSKGIANIGAVMVAIAALAIGVILLNRGSVEKLAGSAAKVGEVAAL